MHSSPDPLADLEDAIALLEERRTYDALIELAALAETFRAALSHARASGYAAGIAAAGAKPATNSAGRPVGLVRAAAPEEPRGLRLPRARRLRVKTLANVPARVLWLRSAVADPRQRAAAAAALRIHERHLGSILAGRVNLAASAWKRLREALSATAAAPSPDPPK